MDELLKVHSTQADFGGDARVLVPESYSLDALHQICSDFVE
jgi:hypothetical protein